MTTARAILADLVLVGHVLFVTFVVLGFLAILLGAALKWRWVRGYRFRLLHLLAIGVVAVQALVGVICPLTTLEQALRRNATQATYQGTFISHWLQRLIFFDADPWVFTTAYVAFALAVLGTWWWVPPQRRRKRC